MDPYYYKKHCGGTEVQLNILSKAMLSMGWEVHYVTSDIDEKIVDEGIVYYPFRIGSSVLRSYRRFASLLNGINAEVYYQRGRKKFTYLLGRYSRESDKYCVFAAALDLDFYYSRFGKLSLNRSIKTYYALLKWMPSDILTFWALKQFDLVLSQNEIQRDGFKKYCNIKSEIFINLHEKPLSKECLNFFDKKKTILWLANIKQIKRPEFFLDIVKRLSDKPYEFVMAGAIQEKKYRDIIENVRKKSPNFSYLGRIPFKKTNELFALSKVFINTSLIEGFPNTFIQAWLMGVPVVTHQLDPDNIIAENGLGYCCRDIDEMCSKIDYLLNNEDIYIKMKEKIIKFSKRYVVGKRKYDFVKLINPCNQSNIKVSR